MYLLYSVLVIDKELSRDNRYKLLKRIQNYAQNIFAVLSTPIE